MLGNEQDGANTPTKPSGSIFSDIGSGISKLLSLSSTKPTATVDKLSDSEVTDNNEFTMVRNEQYSPIPKTSTTPPILIEEFDPLCNKEEDLLFLNSPPRASAVASTPITYSLLDTSIEYATPSSIAKYTEKEVDKIRQEERSKHEKEFDLLQNEVTSLQKKYEKSLQDKSEIEAILKQYEATMSSVIDSAKKKEEEQQKSVDIAIHEKRLIETELNSVQIAFKDLHVRYEDLKIVQETYKKNENNLKEIISTLQKDIQASEVRYETIKSHAESKIEEANREISKVRANYEKEIATLKAKLSKSEISIKSLENAIETKTKENSELMKICDQLIQKMDS